MTIAYIGNQLIFEWFCISTKILGFIFRRFIFVLPWKIAILVSSFCFDLSLYKCQNVLSEKPIIKCLSATADRWWHILALKNTIILKWPSFFRTKHWYKIKWLLILLALTKKIQSNNGWWWCFPDFNTRKNSKQQTAKSLELLLLNI